MWPNPHFPEDLITFTEEILDRKLHFLCSVNFSSFCPFIASLFLLQLSFPSSTLHCQKGDVRWHQYILNICPQCKFTFAGVNGHSSCTLMLSSNWKVRTVIFVIRSHFLLSGPHILHYLVAVSTTVLVIKVIIFTFIATAVIDIVNIVILLVLIVIIDTCFYLPCH